MTIDIISIINNIINIKNALNILNHDESKLSETSDLPSLSLKILFLWNSFHMTTQSEQNLVLTNLFLTVLVGGILEDLQLSETWAETGQLVKLAHGGYVTNRATNRSPGRVNIETQSQYREK